MTKKQIRKMIRRMVKKECCKNVRQINISNINENGNEFGSRADDVNLGPQASRGTIL